MKTVHATLCARGIGLVFLASTFLPALSASPANAGDDAPANTVRFGDLNLTSPHGVATLYKRIVSAAESVCGPAFITGSLLPRPSYVACRKKAIADAVAKIDRPELTRYYLAREGHLTEQDTAGIGGGAQSGG